MERRSLIAPTAIVFDFDLTLADSVDGFVAGHHYASESLALPEPSREQVARAIGTPLELVVPRLFPAISQDTAAEYVRLYRASADEVMLGLTRMLPGAVEAVRELREAAMRLAIVSQKLRHLVEEVLQREDIHDCFDVVLGGQDVPAFKPDPRGLQLALDRLNAHADDAVYVGDTVIDAQAASNAGLRFVGVLTGPTTRDELERYPHLTLLSSIAELPSFLGV